MVYITGRNFFLQNILWTTGIYEAKWACAARESNPGRKNGNLAWYHYTSGAIYVVRIMCLNCIYGAVVAEWLRRLTRNQMGFPRAGSNPAGCERVLFLKTKNRCTNKRKRKKNASCEDWTHDPWFTRPVLYHWAKEARSTNRRKTFLWAISKTK